MLHKKKAFINKNRITANIVARFTQKYSYIRLSLGRRRLQSFKPLMSSPVLLNNVLNNVYFFRMRHILL